MKGVTIGVLRGGPSTEYDVSLKTGAGVLAALGRVGAKTKDIVISKQGKWLCDGFPLAPAVALEGVDVVFIALHGEFGEDGKVQRILEQFGVPYTGSGPYASALAMNKVMTKDQVKPIGVRTAKHMLIRRDGRPDPIDTAHAIAELFGPGYVIKPLRGGSSIDTVMASNVGQLAQSITNLLKSYEEVLVEERIVGKETTVGVLEGYRDASLYVLPVIEILPPQGADFFDYNNKYNGASEEICPGRFSEKEREELQSAALAIHNALALRHYSRSDFILTSDGPVFLEVNTLPGLTSESLFPRGIDAVGGTYDELVTHLVQLALTKKK